ncbi:septal ring lytic transglycosylase RlpA family protein [Alsobacter sp. KACC 23698]|uniref:Endolytic peptidoglycan transglycosylase RlpA n=1 Tax=Alsobacter sp. KACC 23698 TaxID=3149229 RepID=A0AAU7JM99_9HYPH
MGLNRISTDPAVASVSSSRLSILQSSSASFLSVSRGTALSRGARIGAAIAIGLVAANCSSSPTRVARGGGVDPKYGVSASPRVVADGQPVPKGGGRDLVGKPYVVAGRLYTPREIPNYSSVGTASWYGSAFHGRLTANGEVFDRNSITAAHPTLPLPSYIRVTNMDNGYSMIARVNDRGPYHGNRLIDVSQRVAESLRFKHIGTARVRVDYVGRAALSGSDDERLYATLRNDGLPAQLRGSATLVASAEPAYAPQPILAARQAPAAPAQEPEDDSAQEAAAPVQPSRTIAAPRTAQPAASSPVVAALPLGRPAPGVPLPPDRPFDLGTIPNAAKPVAAPVRRTAQTGGAVTAGLFYAQAEPMASSFRKDDPMGRLIQQNFVPLRSGAQF